MNYEIIPSEEIIKKTVEALKERNVSVVIVEDSIEALSEIKKLIPLGSGVMSGSSTTLNQIGFVEYLKDGAHGWNNMHQAILEEKDEKKQSNLRKESILADYFLGSVHAITEKGQMVIASCSGSQVPSYAFSSNNVIFVASANKIVPTLEEAFKRIDDYVFPLENKRMQSVGSPGSCLGKILIFEREVMPTRKIHLILVKEKLGF